MTNYHRLNRRQTLAVLLLFLAPLAARAQDKSLSYGFVSPNTAENLTLADAVRNLNSPEEKALVAETLRVGCRARFRPQVMRAVGSWSDGAEHSTVFKTTADRQALRYAVAALGKYARQKAVLYFQQTSDGPARLYVLRPRERRSFAAISRTLDRAGVAFRTLAPLQRSTIVYVVDLQNDLGSKVSAAARLLRARLRSVRGQAEFLGHDSDREQAQVLFENEIKRYEDANPKIPARCRGN
jgi:hypothetical protein